MKTKKKLSDKAKLRLLQVSGGIVTFAPLAVTVGVNLQDYISTPASAVSLTAGGAMAAAVVVLQMLGKGKKLLGSAVIISGIVFALSILLEPLVLNLKLLTGMVFLGEGAYAVGFKAPIARIRKRIEQTEQATVMRQVLQEPSEPSGRV